MAYAPNNFFGDGSQTDFIYTFEVLGGFSVVIVKTKVVGGVLVKLTRGVEYEEIDPKTIRFNSGFIPAGDGTEPLSTLINVTRFTSRSRLIDYIGGATIRERDLDNDYNRLTSVDEEIEVGVFAALFKNDAQTAWAGEGLPSEDCSPATKITGWTTLGQVQALVSNLNVVDLSTPIINVFTGDGVETEFELNGVRSSVLGQANVYINSMYQSSDQAAGIYSILHEDDSDYPSGGDGDDFISFEEPPPLNAAIEVKHFTGVVLGVLPSDFVNLATQISDNLIDLQHLGIDAGVSHRLIVFDDTGDVPVARRIGIGDLLAGSQTLGAAVRTALVHVDTGLRLSDFLRANAANVDFKGFKLKNVGTPEADPDGANKAYVDGKLVQITRGKITTGLPQGLDATLDITVGFQPDFFVMLVQIPSSQPGTQPGPHWLKHMFIRSGSDTQRTQDSVASQASGDSAYASRFKIGIQTSTKVRVTNTYINSVGVPLTNITDITWFALKLGV